MLHSSTTVQINLTILSILFHVSTVPSFSQIWVHFCGEIPTPATTRLLPTLQSPSSPCRRSSQRWGRRPTKNEGWNHQKCSLNHEKMGFTTKYKYITKLWISTCDRQCLARLGHWRHSPPWKLGTICPSMLGLRSEASMKAHWNLRDATKSSKQKSTWKASQTRYVQGPTPSSWCQVCSGRLVPESFS